MYQNIQIIGDIGKDPEMRYTPSGQPVTNFSVAVTNKYTRSDDEEVKETFWFRVSVWGGMAEPCYKYLSTGSRVFVEGTLLADKETGGPRTFKKQDGDWGASFEIKASTVKFLDKLSKPGGNGKSKGKKASEEYEEIPGFARD